MVNREEDNVMTEGNSTDSETIRPSSRPCFALFMIRSWCNWLRKAPLPHLELGGWMAVMDFFQEPFKIPFVRIQRILWCLHCDSEDFCTLDEPADCLYRLRRWGTFWNNENRDKHSRLCIPNPRTVRRVSKINHMRACFFHQKFSLLESQLRFSGVPRWESIQVLNLNVQVTIPD